MEAIRRTPADRLVARRLYMMEAALEAGRSGADAPAAIVEVFESEVLRRRGGMLGAALRPEARRTARDERRCMREARSLVALGDEERAVAETVVGTAVPRLDVAFPPAGDRPRPTPAAPVALFLGDRRWAPNAAGLRRLYRLWPEIRERVRAAELLIVGVAGPREPSPPEGARASGFVDDLAGVWGAARVMLAPLPVGGGVRVKVLEAAARGVPVVGSPAALGSISSYLDLPAVPDDEAFVARAAELLADRAAAERAGATLWEANARHVAGGGVERAVVEWLGDGA